LLDITRLSSKVTHPYPDSQAILFCFNLNEPISFRSLSVKIKTIGEFGGNYLFYLVGCKSDLEQKVPEEEIAKFAKEYDLIYFKCSAK
jgi:GTPase SAR1 family protein